MLSVFSLCSYLQERAAKDKSFTYEVPFALKICWIIFFSTASDE
jgi:hypothetical protein